MTGTNARLAALDVKLRRQGFPPPGDERVSLRRLQHWTIHELLSHYLAVAGHGGEALPPDQVEERWQHLEGLDNRRERRTLSKRDRADLKLIREAREALQ